MSRTEREVDLTRSWARRGPRGVRITLVVDGVEHGSQLRLRSRDRVVTAPLDVTGRELVAEVPDLPPGTWRLATVAGGTDDVAQPLQARLLLRRGQPVALLPGPRPSTAMAPPAPRGRPDEPRRGARQAAARVVDRALQPLPQQAREAVRTRLARLGRPGR